jgi:hypothetical protein
MVLFPGWLVHQVPVNASAAERVSIAFNLMFRQFGETASAPLWKGRIPVTLPILRGGLNTVHGSYAWSVYFGSVECRDPGPHCARDGAPSIFASDCASAGVGHNAAWETAS